MKRKARADGRYQAKVSVGAGQVRYVYAATQKELDAKVTALKSQRLQGVDLARDGTLSAWIDRWLVRQEQQQTPEWYALCKIRAEFWRDRLGDADVRELTAVDLEDALLQIAKHNPNTDRPSSAKTVHEYASIIRRVFALCRQARVLTFDPTEFMSEPKAPGRAKKTPVNDIQIQAIRRTPHETQIACMIMIYAGLRLGELAALTWSDVDLAAATITVNKALNFKAAGAVKGPKTAAGNRTVPIPAPLLEALSAAPRTSLLVCPHRGGPYTNSAWRNALNGYAKIIGFPLRAHDLRHTCCTLYYEAGVDVLTAQRWMGHADPSTTMQIYTHLREEKERGAVSKLNEYFSPKAETLSQ